MTRVTPEIGNNETGTQESLGALPTAGQQSADQSDAQLEQSHKSIGEAEQAKMVKRARYHKKWIRRFRLFFCCLGYKKNKDSIADVAGIFAEFYAGLKVSSSEVAAGFVLLSKYQTAQRQWIVNSQQFGVEQYLSTVPITAQTKFLDLTTAEDSHLINDLIYYMNYGLAIFGWPMQMIDDPCMLCCICPYLSVARCCGGCRRGSGSASKEKAEDGLDKKPKDGEVSIQTTQPISAKAENGNLTRRQSIPGKLDEPNDFPIVQEDNCCGCNVASVERRLAAHNFEIIYATYKVNVSVVPFLVCADHSKRSIVVALRGSMSLSDMVTDMNGQVDKLPIDNCPDDWLCHRGMTKAASYVKSTLLEQHILDRAFNCRPDLGSQDYTLILCGHSLGAGVAAILGIILRKNHPNLKAYLFSPPGGMLSLSAVEYTKEFATGIMLGNDCVPRLGVAQLERLRYYVLLSLKSSPESNGKVLARALCPSCCFGDNEVEYDPSLSLNLLHGTSGRSFEYNGSKIPFQVQPQVLYVPGRLIHIIKNHTFKSKARRIFNQPIYQALWNDNTMYDRIIISEGMFFDHLPNNLMHAMKMLFSKTLPARKVSKSSALESSDRSPCQTIPNGPQNDNSNPIHGRISQMLNQVLETKQREQDGDKIVINDFNNNKHDSDNNINSDDDKSTIGIGNSRVDRSNGGKSTSPEPIERIDQIGDDLPTDIIEAVKSMSYIDKSFDSNGNDETVKNNNHQ